MRVYNNIEDSDLSAKSMVAVGVFDGLHVGHRSLLQQLVEESKRRNMRSVVVSFARHPGCVLGHRNEELWLDEEHERIDGILELGVAQVVMMDFTTELAALSACEFVEELLIGKLNMGALLLGYDSRFGNRKKDDFEELPTLALRRNFEILRDAPLMMEGDVVSSSRIRRTLGEGDVAFANRMLGREYELMGKVVHGREVGRQLGFPTANVDLSQCRKIMPKDGVYEVVLSCCKGVWKGMANLGNQPTFTDGHRAFEVHLVNFIGDLYDCEVRVMFVRRLRDIERFESKEALIEQLERDLKMIKGA